MVIVLPQYVGSYVDLFGNDLGLYEYVLYVFTLSAVQKNNNLQFPCVVSP